jgi:hypothetical protein
VCVCTTMSPRSHQLHKRFVCNLATQFTTLLKVGMLDDLVCLYHRPSQVVHSLVALGPDICGHGGIVHGGMSATVTATYSNDYYSCSSMHWSTNGRYQVNLLP